MNSRIKRFKENVEVDDAKSHKTIQEKEEELAYYMLMQDFDLIRKKISECMLESIAGKVEVEK